MDATLIDAAVLKSTDEGITVELRVSVPKDLTNWLLKVYDDDGDGKSTINQDGTVHVWGVYEGANWSIRIVKE